MNIKDTEVKHQKVIDLFINFDFLPEIEVVGLKRNGKTIYFPLWEFWQTLQKQDDIGRI